MKIGLKPNLFFIENWNIVQYVYGGDLVDSNY